MILADRTRYFAQDFEATRMDTFDKALESALKVANWLWTAIVVTFAVPIVLFLWYLLGAAFLNVVLGIPVLMVFFLCMIVFGPGAVHDALDAFVKTKAGYGVIVGFHVVCVPVGAWLNFVRRR